MGSLSLLAEIMLQKFLISSLTGLSLASILPSSDPKWSEFKTKFNKRYASIHHEESAYKTFMTNLASIKLHNANPSNTFQKDINQFTDMTNQELAADRLMSLPYPEEDMEFECPLRFRAPESIPMPTSLDWRTTNNPAGVVAVSAVKDQGSCGSCYAFSATGAMEGSLCMNGYYNCTTWVGLSEQQIVDCASYMPTDYTKDTEPVWYEGFGCSGSWQSNVFQYVYVQGGISCEHLYPYVSGTEVFDNKFNNQECAYDPDMSHGYVDKHICGTTSKDGPNPRAMAEALYFKGPLAVGMFVGGDFSSYSSGVYVPGPNDCPNLEETGINHAMLAVGFGEELVNGVMTPYWVIKNSWGPTWGDNGFIKVVRGQNACGIEGNTAFVDMVGTEDEDDD